MGRQKIGKAKEIYDAKIQFVSLVDAAANKRKFLMTKARDGTASFVNYGRILKTDAESHYVTGVVYEPMTEDTDGEFMTAEEIRKAAYYYVKNFEKVDVQHSFEPDKNCAVVESWIAKADFSIGSELVKEGSWLMTVEITDNDLWNKVEKGEITGFSMGGICMCSEEEVELADVTKNEADKKAENKGLLAKFAEFLGFDVVEKGNMAEIYTLRVQGNNFWTALDSFESALRHYDYNLDRYVYETDEDVIREALEDFSKIITGLLTGTQSIAKAIEGPESITKCSSEKNNEETEGKEVTKSEAEEFITKAVANALGKSAEQAEIRTTEESVKTEGGAGTAEKSAGQPEIITPELLEKMVTEAVAKAQQPAEKNVTLEDVQDMVTEAVAKAMDPIRKANHLPSNLNNETVDKSANKPEEHYLHGIL